MQESQSAVRNLCDDVPGGVISHRGRDALLLHWPGCPGLGPRATTTPTQRWSPCPTLASNTHRHSHPRLQHREQGPEGWRYRPAVHMERDTLDAYFNTLACIHTHCHELKHVDYDTWRNDDAAITHLAISVNVGMEEGCPPRGIQKLQRWWRHWKVIRESNPASSKGASSKGAKAISTMVSVRHESQ